MPLGLSIAIVACTDATSPQPVASVIVSPDSIMADRGDTLAFTAALFDAAGHPVPGRTVTWASSDTSVIAVGTAGIAITRGVGSAWVNATADSLRDSARVTVRLPIVSVTLEPDTLTTVPGLVIPALAIAHTPDSTGADFYGSRARFTTSNPAVATVDSAGVVLGGQSYAVVTTVDTGWAVIRATASGKADSMVVHVRKVSFVSVSVGYQGGICAMSTDTHAFCWGDSPLGLNNGLNVLVPTMVPDSLHLTSVSPGEGFVCGLRAAGTAACWGAGDHGRLGNGIVNVSEVPVVVSGGHALAGLASGHSTTCALDAGAAHCWGWNSQGELGDSAAGSESLIPVAVTGGLTFATISSGNYRTCALLADSSAYCWGSAVFLPTLVPGGIKFASVTPGFEHVCGLASGGVAYCWGSNSIGELGTGDSVASASPVAVTGGLTFTAVTVGGWHNYYGHTCGLVAGGTAYCWGANNFGELGDGTMIGRAVPTPVSGGLHFNSITAGGTSTCGIATDGILYCWGAHYGVGMDDVPTRVPGQP